MIWDIAKVVGALGSGTGVLLGPLIDQSLELRLFSAVVFAAVPAAAALVLGATLVCLLKLLGIVYDLLRTLLLPRIVKLASSLKGDFGGVLIWGAGRLIRFMRASVMWIGQILKSTQTRARTGLAWVSREIALEALRIKHSAGRLKDLARSSRAARSAAWGG